jgi:hypothetical protein
MSARHRQLGRAERALLTEGCRTGVADRVLSIQASLWGELPDAPGSYVVLPQSKGNIMAKSRGEVEADIKETLGLVPHFFSRIRIGG